MSIGAKIIADSCQGFVLGRPVRRLTTFELRYPRFIHAELMTHRVFSRNASSSRAIPIQKLIQEVIDDPAMPVWWGKNQAGMQAREELDDTVPLFPGTGTWTARRHAAEYWLKARNAAVEHVEKLMAIGLHKQLANRLLEPWSHINVLVTSTDWANWYALRNHPDAQPEMQALAAAMLAAHRLSVSQELKPGEWHLPYIRPADRTWEWIGEPLALPKVSAARCARVSFNRHDGTPAPQDEDLSLFQKLMGGNPKHASPAEHPARVPSGVTYSGDLDRPENDYVQTDRYSCQLKPGLESNLMGWIQLRKLVKGENVRSYEEFER